MIDVFPCLLLSGQTTQGYYLLEHGICKTKCTFVRVKVDKKLRLVLQLTSCILRLLCRFLHCKKIKISFGKQEHFTLVYV